MRERTIIAIVIIVCMTVLALAYLLTGADEATKSAIAKTAATAAAETAVQLTNDQPAENVE